MDYAYAGVGRSVCKREETVKEGGKERTGYVFGFQSLCTRVATKVGGNSTVGFPICIRHIVLPSTPTTSSGPFPEKFEPPMV